MKRILGVDPGGSGALALLEGAKLIDVVDMPVFMVARGRGFKPEIDTHALIALLRDWKPDACWFERVGGMDGQSASAAFNFGRVAGNCEAIVKASGTRFDFVSPHVWKGGMKLINAAKDDARAKATNMWPHLAERFRRKMDDGRAEAALIAEYGRREYVTQGIFG